MNSNAILYAKNNEMNRKDVKCLLEKILPNSKIKDENITAIDIGCGPGDITRDILLNIPNVKKVIAFDILPSMIEFAKLNNPHPMIEYHVADAVDKRISVKWGNSVSIAFSSFCLHWVKSQQSSFENIFDILKEGGEAIIIFVVGCEVWKTFDTLKTLPKWAKYRESTHWKNPEFYHRKKDIYYYRKILEKIGFDILSCYEELKIFTFENDVAQKDWLESICPLIRDISQEDKEEFVNDLFEDHINRNGRDSNSHPQTLYTPLHLHLKKPKIN